MTKKRTSLAAISEKLKSPLTETETTLKLRQALLFYEGMHDVAVAFEYRDGQLTNPKPLAAREIMEFLPEEDSSRQESTVFPKRVLSRDPICWWVPAGRRRISIRKDPRKTYGYPPLVFKINKGKLFVARLPVDEHPDCSTLLLKPPFGGIDVHGSVMGSCNVKTPKRQAMQDIPEWENAFFLSTFNFPPSREKPQSLGVKLEQWIKQ